MTASAMPLGPTPHRPLSAPWASDAERDHRGRLRIGGCDAISLAETHGTPLYVLSEHELRERARAYATAMRTHHAGPGRVLLAVKALPVGAVVRLFAAEGLGALVCTGGELTLALRAGMAPEHVVFHGNAKSRAELELAVGAGIGLISIDNRIDIDNLEHVLLRRGPGRPQPVIVRVNPGVDVDTHKAVRTGHAASKFGVALEEASELIRRIEAHPALEMRGLHAHIGSQLLDVAPYTSTVRTLAGVGSYPVLDLGGGLGVSYTSAEAPPSIDDHVRTVADAVRAHSGNPRDVTLIVEPGRALTASAGTTLYRVETVKRNVSTWVAVDGGMSDNLRPMLYGARYEAHIADRFTWDREAAESCRLCGKHCESGDLLVPDARLRDPRRGDIVAMPATGAYGHAMANTYNTQPRPAVVMVARGEARVVVRRETLDDVLARDMDLG